MRSGLDAREGFVIEPCKSIHMMFMRFPIDAVFYDRDLKVTRTARGLRPWRGFAFGGRGAHAVVELAAGAAAGTEPGHCLEFDDREEPADSRS